MRVLDLFSGIGGFALGLHRAGGYETVGFCEIDPWCREVLRKHWPEVWQHDDIKTLTAELVGRNCGRIDMLCGGFPCTDISVAGKGEGIYAERSGLWWEMLRLVRELRPGWVFIENVPALRTRGADDVLGGLEAEGYTCRAFVVGAEHVGAPHRRHRVWIVANSEGAIQRAFAGSTSGCEAKSEGEACGRLIQEGLRRSNDGRSANTGDELANATSRGQRTDGLAPRQAGHADECGEAVADAERDGRRSGSRVAADESDTRIGRREPAGGVQLADAGIAGLAGRRERAGGTSEEVAMPSGSNGACQWPARPGEQQHEWEAPRLTQSGLGQSVDGLPRRLDGFARRNRLKALGNAVVPQVVEVIGRAIQETNR